MKRPDPVELVAIAIPLIAEVVAVSLFLCAAFVYLVLFSELLP